MRVLVTGVTGRIGSSVAQHLVQAGHRVRGTVRPRGQHPHRSIGRDIEIVKADLRDADALARAVSGMEVVVHAASQAGVDPAHADQFFDVNLCGTVRLLEAAAQAPHSVQRFVFLSAANVYGLSTPHARPIIEETPVAPGDYSGLSKVLAEQVLRSSHQLYGVEYTILRLGWVMAPNEAPLTFRLNWAREFLSAHIEAGRRSHLWPLFAGHHEAPTLLETAARSRTDNPAVLLTGPAGQPWAIHVSDVRDVAAGVILAIDHKSAADEVFNIAGPRNTFNDTAAALARRCDTDVLTVRMPVALTFTLATTKARDLLGYEPAWRFDATLRSSFDWDEWPSPTDYVPVGEA